MKMPVTQDATALDAHASLEEVDASTTLVAVGGDLRAAKYFVPGHVRWKMRNSATIAKVWCTLPRDGLTADTVPETAH